LKKCALRAPGEAEIAGSNPAGATNPQPWEGSWKSAPCARPARLRSRVRIPPGLPPPITRLRTA